MKHHLLSLCVAGVLTTALAGCDAGSSSSAASGPRSSAVAAAPAAAPAPSPEAAAVKEPDKLTRTDEQWRQQLTAEQYRVARQAGTEAPWSSALTNEKKAGEYRCVGCDTLLFTSDTKFDSHCGWPSFFKPDAKFTIGERVDRTHGMVRTEVFCNKCGAHLGHVFEDSPQVPTGLRYCINGVVLKFTPKEGVAKK